MLRLSVRHARRMKVPNATRVRPQYLILRPQEQRRQISSGPKGIDNRLPFIEPEPSTPGSSTLTVTDPLMIYRSYVARGILKPDPQQLRCALELQKLYFRVKDYVPNADTAIKINQLVRELEVKLNGKRNEGLLYSYIGYRPQWYAKKQDNEKKELIKLLTDEEELENFPSPQGLLINGEVGCGKSLLMDMFANSLPHDSKCRWHYNNFMLWVYAQIHEIYQRRRKSNQENHTMLSLENELILFEIASKMISKNTVLLLDEFMLPDLAAAKIVKILFTYFFKLGGVLVATSNRLPDELYTTTFNKNSFTGFETILKLRCHTFDMNSEYDYREILSKESEVKPYLIVKNDSNDHHAEWDSLLSSIIKLEEASADHFTVYGRRIKVPYHSNGCAKFEFGDICQGLYGPGDYISIASRYHTVIIDNIPILTTKMKSEARRFITLLDSLYEARCKVVMRTEVDPSQLFFPDLRQKSESTGSSSDLKASNFSNMDEVQQEEMFSRTSIDVLNPYRPNVSSYDEGSNDFQISKDVKETNFKDISRFTGEDEMFAFKRAVSRIREMTGSAIWRMEGRWIPNDTSMRPWEKQVLEEEQQTSRLKKHQEQVLGYIANKTRFDTTYGNAPGFAGAHFWSMGLWGKGTRLKDEIAKKWIRGAES